MNPVYKHNKTVKEKQSTLDLVQQTHMRSLVISTAKWQYPNIIQVSFNLGSIPVSIKLRPRNNNNKWGLPHQLPFRLSTPEFNMSTALYTCKKPVGQPFTNSMFYLKYLSIYSVSCTMSPVSPTVLNTFVFCLICYQVPV